MAESARRRRLIVNADDFGLSAAINEAVCRAHREGILTTTSLMVNGEACAQAVEMARAIPTLGVGLHLTLVHGRATLPRAELAGLVDETGHFSYNPVAVGWRYFFNRALREPLQREIEAQFAKFAETELPLDHVNGHLNLHLHPTVFGLLEQAAANGRFTRLRLTRDDFWLNASLASGAWAYRISHALIFNGLAAAARPRVRRLGLRTTDRVFGLLQNSRVDEDFLLRLLPRLPAGDSELYSHPSLDQFRHELDALVSPRVRRTVQEAGVQLIRYQDL